MMKNTLLAYIFLFISSQLVAQLVQPSMQDCVEKLKFAYLEMQERMDKFQLQGYYIKYGVYSSSKIDPKGSEERSEIKLYVKDQDTYFFSTDVEVFQNKNTSIRVFPQHQQIRIYNHGVTSSEKKLRDYAQVAYDTLFEMGHAISCEMIRQNGKEIMKVEWAMDEKAREVMKITRLNYFMDYSTNEIVEVEIFYTSESTITYLRTVIEESKFGKEVSMPSDHIMGMVYAGENIHPDYQNYSVLDKRTVK